MQILDTERNKSRRFPLIETSRVLLFSVGVTVACQVIGPQSIDSFLTKKVFGIIPEAEANSLFDYSGRVPDGALQVTGPKVSRSIPAQNVTGEISEDKTVVQTTTVAESPQPTETASAQTNSVEIQSPTSDSSKSDIVQQQPTGTDRSETNIVELQVTEMIPVENTNVVPDNVWDRIRSGFAMADLDNKIVRKYEKFYSDNPKTMERIIERAQHFLPHIVLEVERRGLPLELSLLPIVESAYNPRAYSRAGAAGLWQFMPFTGKQYGLTQNWWYEGRRDVIDSTDAALRHLYDLSQVFDNDWHLVLAAYNAGLYGVQKAIKRNQKRDKPTDYSSLRLKVETRHFVPKLIAVRNIVSDPEAFGLTLPYLAMEPRFEVIEFDFQVDLGIIATETRIQEYTLARLNPGLRRTVTPPNGPHRVLVPPTHYHDVMRWKSTLLPSRAVDTVFYIVKKGDVLGTIAEKFNVSVSAVKSVNSMNTDLIRIGELLRIPKPAALARSDIRTNANGEVIYRVKKGDILGTIAQKYDVSVSAIKSANVLYSDMIRVGQKLRIPVPGSRTIHGKTATNANQPKLRQNQQYVDYTVRSGDSLYKIAKVYGIAVANLRVANSLSSDRILVGQKLKVPVNDAQTSKTAATVQQGALSPSTRYVYIVRSGDSLWRIARNHQTSVSSLEKWNDIDRDDKIRIGQRIIIYVQ